MTSAGRPSWAMTLAIVKVLPEPVTPSKVWWGRPSPRPRTSCSIAAGWSPAGGNGLTNWNSGMVRSDPIRSRGGLGLGPDPQIRPQRPDRRRPDPRDPRVEVVERAERGVAARLDDPR